MLFVLVLEFFICWTPLYVINTMTMLIGPVVYEYVDYTAISILQLLAYSSSCCNPITYCFMNASFRRAFVDTFKGLRLCEGGHFRLCKRRSNNKTDLSVAGNSIVLANSVISSHTILESPRLWASRRQHRKSRTMTRMHNRNRNKDYNKGGTGEPIRIKDTIGQGQMETKSL